MLPTALKSIYQQYKADTDVVANWLATTAYARGYSSVGSDPPAKTPGTKAQHVLAIKDFTPMAAHLANTATLKVPHFFAVAIERAIRVRKAFSKKLAASGAFTDIESDSKHAYFVNVLEEVRNLLKPALEAGVFNAEELKNAETTTEKSKNPLTNVFGILGVYEPSDAFINAPDVVVPKTPELEYIAESDKSTDEAIFALTALFDDYELLRTEITSLWAKYVAGSLDLAAVSVATNTAFEIARALEDDIQPILENNGGSERLVYTYFEALSSARGVEIMPKQRPYDAFNLEAYDIAKICLVNTQATLNRYRADNPPNTTFIIYDGVFGWYDEALGASGETNRRKDEQDTTGLLEILTGLHFLCSHLGKGLVEDEMVRGMDAMMNAPWGSTTPLWFAWAAQIYLDILQNLGKDCDKGYHEMQQEVFKIKKAMADVPIKCPERNNVLGRLRDGIRIR
ncbi:Uu.00g031160.m01.CDS01 [Anthostomella pinea]|uniref:Uu.00g031160.m01.CDS01 n=1 Tax=Anthostomella pinea TaxID=933095 RepID=A0AAI8V8H1_9PEZI|nr:Uu.00g031160.m01.CDS01 [Anthostomella pinea]